MKKSCALPKSAFPLKFRVRSPRHALELARDLIRPIRNWTQGSLARGAALNRDPECRPKVRVKSPQAEAFCALGALRRVNTRHEKPAQKFLVQAAADICRPDDTPRDREQYPPSENDIFDVNDAYGHRDVMNMFRRAITLAKRAEKGA
jgi:hypothetical protein